MPDPADCQMHANAALCRVRSLAGQGGESAEKTWKIYSTCAYAHEGGVIYCEESSRRIEHWTRAEFLCPESPTPSSHDQVRVAVLVFGHVCRSIERVP
jgi:hypothetical protein